jgi:ligand-binding sensor domain-containing protein
MRRVLCLGFIFIGLLVAPGRAAGQSPASRAYVVERWRADDGLPNNALTSVIQTRDGYLWVATWAGITRFDGVRFTPVATTLPNDHARALVEDADGSVWIGLSGTGVARWRPGGVEVVTPEQGLAGADVRALALDEGRLWLATENGVSAIERGRVATWRTRDGLPSNNINGLARGPQGGVWIATADGLCHATRLQVECRADARDLTLYAVLETRDGRLWIGTDRGLLSGPASLSADLVCRGECFAGRTVTALMQAKDGGLWIGFADGELVHRLNGIETRYGAADGLPSEGPVGLVEDEEGSVWAATNGGLVRLRPARVAMLTTANGLPVNTIGSIVQDTSGTIWAGTSCGPVSALADLKRRTLSATLRGAHQRRLRVGALGGARWLAVDRHAESRAVPMA